MRPESIYALQSLTPRNRTVKVKPVDAKTNLPIDSKWTRRFLLAAEVALILTILGLLIAFWLPVWIGAHPGMGPQ